MGARELSFFINEPSFVKNTVSNQLTVILTMIISTFLILAIFAITLFHSFTTSADQNLDGMNQQIPDLEKFLSSTSHSGYDNSYYAEAWRRLGTINILCCYCYC